jgi:lipid-A-disaccharide synthase-like uncharacterized protein
MFHQWIKTEQARRIISPSLFWVFSICGSWLLMLYGWLRSDFAILLGQFLSYYIYLWNLNANGIWQKLSPLLRILLASTPPLAMFSLLLSGGEVFTALFRNPSIPPALLAFGCFSQALFTVRFLYQWRYSVRHGSSVLPMGFWYISFAGASLIVLYALFRLDIVLILGQALGLIAYSRNIIIGLRTQRR